MALSRGLRCCQRAFAWLPVLIIALVVLWSYYAYVCELCLGERGGGGGGQRGPGPRLASAPVAVGRVPRREPACPGHGAALPGLGL